MFRSHWDLVPIWSQGPEEKDLEGSCMEEGLVREPAQTGWRETGALSPCRDRWMEKAEVGMSLLGA